VKKNDFDAGHILGLETYLILYLKQEWLKLEKDQPVYPL